MPEWAFPLFDNELEFDTEIFKLVLNKATQEPLTKADQLSLIETVQNVNIDLSLQDCHGLLLYNPILSLHLIKTTNNPYFYEVMIENVLNIQFYEILLHLKPTGIFT